MSDQLEKLHNARNGQQRALSEEELLEEDLRYEVIDGIIYMMAPPEPIHQDVLGEIYHEEHEQSYKMVVALSRPIIKTYPIKN